MTMKCPNLKIVVTAAVNMKLRAEQIKEEKLKRKLSDKKLMPEITIEHVDKQRLEPLTPLQSVIMFVSKGSVNLDSNTLEHKKKFNTEYINFIVADFHY